MISMNFTRAIAACLTITGFGLSASVSIADSGGNNGCQECPENLDGDGSGGGSPCLVCTVVVLLPDGSQVDDTQNCYWPDCIGCEHVLVENAIGQITGVEVYCIEGVGI